MNQVDIKNLPKYLREDIERVEKYDRSTSTVYDCFLAEVWGSINLVQTEGIVSPDDAEWLRKEYFYKNLDKGAKND